MPPSTAKCRPENMHLQGRSGPGAKLRGHGKPRTEILGEWGWQPKGPNTDLGTDGWDPRRERWISRPCADARPRAGRGMETSLRQPQSGPAAVFTPADRCVSSYPEACIGRMLRPRTRGREDAGGHSSRTEKGPPTVEGTWDTRRRPSYSPATSQRGTSSCGASTP